MCQNNYIVLLLSLSIMVTEKNQIETGKKGHQ